MAGHIPLIAAGGASALAAVTLDCFTTGGTLTAAGMAGGALGKGLEFASSLGQGAAGDALKRRFATDADYREVQKNHDLDLVLHRAVADTCRQVADRLETSGDERGAKALRFIAESGVLVPMETLNLVEVFAMTTTELRAAGGSAESGGRTLSRETWDEVFGMFLERAQKTPRWIRERQILSPEARDETVDMLHVGFPAAVRNAVAHDAASGGRAFAKLLLLMLGETLALVREVKAGASGETAEEAARVEADLQAAETAFRKGLSDDLRAQLAPVFERFDRLTSHLTAEVDRGADRVIDHIDQRITDLAGQQLDAAEPAPSLAPNKRTDHFMGREDAIAETLAKLDVHPVVFVCGPGGIGKSTLVRHLYDHVSDRPWATDGADYIDLNIQTTASGAVGEVAARLSLKDVQGAAGLVTALARRGARLTILDDIQQAYDGDYEGTRALLHTLTAYRGDMRILVTMRSRPDLPNPAYVEPGKLDPPFDGDLFRSLTSDYDWTEADDAPLAELLDELNGHPLSIVLVAGRLRQKGTVARLLEAWREDPLRIARMAGLRAHSQEDSLNVSLGFSYAALDSYPPEVRALFVTFADLPAGASGEMLRALDAEEEAAALVRLGLLHEEGNRTVALVPVRHFAASKREDASEVDTLHQRLEDYLNAFAQEASDFERWKRNEGKVRRAVLGELANLYAGLDRASQRGDDQYTANMTHGIRRVLSRESSRTDVPIRLRTGIDAANRAGFGEMAFDLGVYLGEVHRVRGEFEYALEAYSAARDTAQNSGFRKGEINAEQGLGDIHLKRGEYEDAYRSFTNARDTSHVIKSRQGEANAERGLGDVHLKRGKVDNAHRSYSAARDAYRDVKDRLGEANSELGLGHTCLKRGDVDGAAQSYTAARSIYREIENERGEAHAERGLGDVHLEQGDENDALTSYSTARVIYQEIKDRLGEGNAERGLGEVHLKRKEFDDARSSFQRALGLYTEVEDAWSIGSTWNDIGDLEHAVGDIPAACAAWRHSLAQMEAVDLGHLHWVKSMREHIAEHCPPASGEEA